jgi:hypothetical protein
MPEGPIVVQAQLVVAHQLYDVIVGAHLKILCHNQLLLQDEEESVYMLIITE